MIAVVDENETAADADNLVTAEEFKESMSHLASGVTIVTTRIDDIPHGCTASAIMSLTPNPPSVLVSLALASRTAELVRESGLFAVNVLADTSDSAQLARRFATSREDKFADIDFATDDWGSPLLGDAVARVSCTVSDAVVLEDHVVLVGRVVSAETPGGSPLVYFQRDLRRLAGTL